jgi:hypothetical protein
VAGTIGQALKMANRPIGIKETCRGTHKRVAGTIGQRIFIFDFQHPVYQQPVSSPSIQQRATSNEQRATSNQQPSNPAILSMPEIR